MNLPFGVNYLLLTLGFDVSSQFVIGGEVSIKSVVFG